MENQSQTRELKIILLVEDDEPIVRAIKKRLEKENLQLIISYDGEDGLKQAEEQKPNLILLDLIMPKLDGIGMLRKLRSTEWGKNIPVIILTNLSSPVQEKTASELNISDYLIKTDWKLDDIIKKIKKILEI